MSDSSVIVALSLLQTLRTNIPDGENVSSLYVTRFHEALDKIQGVIDVSDFRIPSDKMFHIPFLSNLDTGEIKYRSGLYIDRVTFLAHIEAVLSLFTSKEDPKWGFAQ